jgi:hypothetical protein
VSSSSSSATATATVDVAVACRTGSGWPMLIRRTTVLPEPIRNSLGQRLRLLVQGVNGIATQLVQDHVELWIGSICIRIVVATAIRYYCYY